MAIPSLTQHGLLPLGIHPATVEEILATFGSSNAKRKEIGEGLARFVALTQTFALFSTLYIDGSFTTDKELPGDSDVVLQLPERRRAELEEHPHRPELHPGAVKLKYKVHLFIEPTELGYAGMVRFFQHLKPKDLLAKNLPANHERGILKVRL